MNKTKVTGKKAKLVEAGCRIDKKIKELKKEFDAIKKQTKEWEEGTYMTSAGDMVVITKVDAWNEPDAKKIYKWLKDQRMSKRFYSMVKVQISELKKLMPEELLNTKFRTKKEVKIVKQCFK